MKALTGFLRQFLSGHNTNDWEIIRLIAFGVGLVFLFNSLWDLVVLKRVWNPQEYGFGSGAMLAGLGAALGWKEKPASPVAGDTYIEKANTVQGGPASPAPAAVEEPSTPAIIRP